MRRVLLFAALLSLLGLTTAFAASLSVQSEDIASFPTDVSISVPGCPPLGVLYLSGDPAMRPGLLAEDPPADPSVNSRSLDQSTGSVKSQTDPLRYHNWEIDPDCDSPLTLSGPAVLRAFQNGSIAPMTVGLFSCPAGAGLDSTGCTQIGADQSSTGTESAGTEVVITIPFTTASIDVGHTLRLQVIDLTNKNWNLQWGYKTNRESRLQVTTS